MQEVFYEESATMTKTGSAKTKYYILKTFSIISYVFAVLWAIIVFNFYQFSSNIVLDIIFILVPLILFIATGILLGRFKDKLYVDYDYTFVSGSIRFSKVIKNIKRKKVLVFDTANIDKLGKYGSDSFYRYESTPGIKKLVLTMNSEPQEGKDFYYLAVTVGGQKYLLILECTQIFISNIIRFSSRTVIEDGFFNKR